MTRIEFLRFYESSKQFFDVCRMLENNTAFIIDGLYSLDTEYNGKIFQCNFNMNVVIDRHNNFLLPIIKLPEIKLTDKFPHIYKDETCCLGLNYEIRKVWRDSSDSETFFREIVDPFLINYLSIINNEKCAIGERPHAENGILDYFSNIFFNGKQADVRSILKYIYAKVIKKEFSKGHNHCPCGSGLIIKKCLHRTDIDKLINELLDNEQLNKAFVKDMEVIIKNG